MPTLCAAFAQRVGLPYSACFDYRDAMETIGPSAPPATWNSWGEAQSPLGATPIPAPTEGLRPLPWLDPLFVAHADRIVRVVAKRGNSSKPLLLVEANGGVLVNSRFKAQHINAMAPRVGSQVVEHQLPESATAELGPHVHA